MCVCVYVYIDNLYSRNYSICINTYIIIYIYIHTHIYNEVMDLSKSLGVSKSVPNILRTPAVVYHIPLCCYITPIFTPNLEHCIWW